jgi:hypothetical protein
MATGDVLMHLPSRKPLHEVDRGQALLFAYLRRLRPAAQCMNAPAQPVAARTDLPRGMMVETVRIAERCTFSLGETRYQ